MEPTNNARIKCMNLYFPVCNYSCVDVKQNIWKGERVIEPGTPSDQFTIIYFTRNTDEENKLETLVPEYTFKNTKLIGFDFLLVSKERMLFGYDEPSPILKPNVRLVKPSPFNRG